MASIDAVIMNLEKMPQQIAQAGEEFVRGSIESHGHVDTGNMLNSVHSQVMGNDVAIWVWTKYAGFVNDGHGGAAPGHIMTFKESPKWPGPIRTRRIRGYGGSHFFEQAYRQLLAYVRTL